MELHIEGMDKTGEVLPEGGLQKRRKEAAYKKMCK